MHILKHTVRKPKGIITIDDPEFAHTIQKETLCCMHCRRHWIVEPGSGKRRGYCYKCAGPTCGSKKCDTCVPFEKAMGY